MAFIESSFQTLTNMLLFASNNIHKIKEIKLLMNGIVEVVGLQEAGIDIDIAEPYDTLKENASAKSSTIFQLTKKNCFSEDTGLEVTALQGAPGVKTARYNETGEFASNNEKLLFELHHHADRSAQFKTVISLYLNGEEHFFEGCCKGRISFEPCGEEGFGYDPVFIPEGSNRCFAEMTMDEKNNYSHRKKAIFKMISFLKDNIASLK